MLTGFALHLLRDLDAVTAGLTLDWSSGSIEGAVNCGLVHDSVSPSAVRHDAAFTPFRVEPLHDSHRHASTPA